MTVYITEKDVWDGTIDGLTISDIIPATEDEWKYKLVTNEYWSIVNPLYSWADDGTVKNVYSNLYLYANGTWTNGYRPDLVRVEIDRIRLIGKLTVNVVDVRNNIIASTDITSSGFSEINLPETFDYDINALYFVFERSNSENFIIIKDVEMFTAGTTFKYKMWDGVIPEDMYKDHIYTSYYGHLDLLSIKTDEYGNAYENLIIDNTFVALYIDENQELITDFMGNNVKLGDLLSHEGELVTDSYDRVYLRYAPTYNLIESTDPEYDYHFGYVVNVDNQYIDSFGDPILNEEGSPITRDDILVFRNTVIVDNNGDVYIKSKYRVNLFNILTYGAGKYWYGKYNYLDYPYEHPSFSQGSMHDVLSTSYQVNLDISVQPYDIENIISRGISHNLISLWESIRPVNRNPDYNLIAGPKVDLTGNPYSLYKGEYAPMFISRAVKKSEALDDAAIFISTDDIDSWTIPHGLGKNVIVRCFDVNFREVVPAYIKLSYSNAFVKFRSNFRGMALIKEARASGLTTSQSTSTLRHITGKKYTITQFYNLDYISVVPNDVYSPSPYDDSIEILETSRTAGYGLYPIDTKEIEIKREDIFLPDDFEFYPYWIVKHNYNLLAVIADCYSPDGFKIRPLGFEFISPDEVKIIFSHGEHLGVGSTVVVSPIGDIGSIEGPIQRNPDGSLYKYDWRLGFHYENEDHRILSDGQYGPVVTDREVFFNDMTYTGKVYKEEEDDSWVYYTIRIPKEGSINIQEIGLFSDRIPIDERKNVIYSKCKGIYKPDGMSLYVIYQVYKDPAGIGAVTEYLIDSDDEYVLDGNNERIVTIRELR